MIIIQLHQLHFIVLTYYIIYCHITNYPKYSELKQQFTFYYLLRYQRICFQCNLVHLNVWLLGASCQEVFSIGHVSVLITWRLILPEKNGSREEPRRRYYYDLNLEATQHQLHHALFIRLNQIQEEINQTPPFKGEGVK